MSKLARCVRCNRVQMGDRWYLEGAVTAIETTEHVDTHCPLCKYEAEKDVRDQAASEDAATKE